MKTLSNSNRLFFTYSFKNDGKYYTTEAKSKSYGNTLFQNFYNKNQDCIEVIEKGNDAPRGGKTGDFVIVKFTEQFFTKWQFALDVLANEKQAKINKENNKLISADNIRAFIKENKELIESKKIELAELKELGDKENWQIKANALVQFVSKNDFSLGWKDIYTLIKNS